jgi:radical SAM protein with 4Fe4S-binding SPASM domain
MFIDDYMTIIKMLQTISTSRPIVIWGTGAGGGKALDFCVINNIAVANFVDIKVDRQIEQREFIRVEKFHDIDVKNTQSLIDNNSIKPYILVASTFFQEISNTLSKWGFVNAIDYINILNPENLEIYNYDKVAREFITENLSGITPIFSGIEIETINRCNGRCTFCPVNAKADTRPKKEMPDELFDNIITQLNKLNYDGAIGLYSNNEPFLDKRIIRFMGRVYDLLPDAFKYIYTNATLMSFDDFLTAIDLLDMMVIDNYTDGSTFLPIVKKVYNYCLDNSKIADKVKICIRNYDQQLTTRGGQAPNRKSVQMGSITCTMPFQQFIVRPDGCVSLCCNDALGKYTLGNLQQQKIIDIWQGEQYKKIRNDIVAGRNQLELCRGCDTIMSSFISKEGAGRWNKNHMQLLNFS